MFLCYLGLDARGASLGFSTEERKEGLLEGRSQTFLSSLMFFSILWTTLTTLEMFSVCVLLVLLFKNVLYVGKWSFWWTRMSFRESDALSFWSLDLRVIQTITNFRAIINLLRSPSAYSIGTNESWL